MTEWEPATETEAAMRDALRAGDQELYFRILSRAELLLPVSAEALAGREPMGWGTWTTGGRTHVLAFTSPAALRACLASTAASSRRTAYPELAAGWPNPEWWLAVNPGLPIEGYLPAWFIAQLSRGDVRLPGRTRARLERVERVARARATAAVPRRAPASGAVPAEPAPGPDMSRVPAPSSPPAGTSAAPWPPADRFPPADRYSAVAGPSPAADQLSVADQLSARDSAPGAGQPGGWAGSQESEPTSAWMTPRRRLPPASSGDAAAAPGSGTPTGPSRVPPPPPGWSGLPDRFGEPTGSAEPPASVTGPAGSEVSLFEPASRRATRVADAQPTGADPPEGGTQTTVAGSEQATVSWSIKPPVSPSSVTEGSPFASDSPSSVFGSSSSVTGGPSSLFDGPASGLGGASSPLDGSASGLGGASVAAEDAPVESAGAPVATQAAPTGADVASAPPTPGVGVPDGGSGTERPSATNPEADAAPRQLPADFTPANDVERSLLEAAGSGSTDTFLSTLLLARVLLPVAPGSAAGSRPGDDGFEWRTELLDGDRYVVVFTSAERLADHLPVSVDTIEVKFAQLIRRWPDDSWSFAVNPGTPVGAKLPGSEIVALANWAADVGLGDDSETTEAVPAPPAEETPRSTYTPAREDPGRPTMMQKTIAPSQLSYYLERGYDRVSGFVHRASEVAHLRTPATLYAALGLGYPNSPFSRDADEAFVLRWPAYRPSLYRIPYGGQNEAAMRAMEGWVIERPPFRGNGFAPGESSDVVAEFKVDSIRLPHGAELWRIGADGSERLVATLDADVPAWRRVGEGD